MTPAEKRNAASFVRYPGRPILIRLIVAPIWLLAAEQTKRVRADLLEYCKQDNLAMVKLHERLLARACDLQGSYPTSKTS